MTRLLTGAGFGGCIIALADEDAVPDVEAHLTEVYQAEHDREVTHAAPPDVAGPAVEFCNAKLLGTLGCAVLIDEDTMQAHQATLDQAVTDLRYGGIAINTMPPFVFLSPYLTWGGNGEGREFVSGRGNFGNLLTAIAAHAEQLVDQLPEPRDPQAPAVQIAAATDRAIELVHRLDLGPNPRLYITHRAHDEGLEYWRWLKREAGVMGVDLDVDKTGPGSKRFYTLRFVEVDAVGLVTDDTPGFTQDHFTGADPLGSELALATDDHIVSDFMPGIGCQVVSHGAAIRHVEQ